MKIKISDIKNIYYSIQKSISEYQANLNTICHKDVNISSSDQINNILYNI